MNNLLLVTVRDALRAVDPAPSSLIARLCQNGMSIRDAIALSRHEAMVFLSLHPADDLGKRCTPWMKKMVSALLSVRGYALCDPETLTAAEAQALFEAFISRAKLPKKNRTDTAPRPMFANKVRVPGNAGVARSAAF